MNPFSQKLILLFLVIVAALAPATAGFGQSAPKAPGDTGAAPTDKGWPRKFSSGANTFAVYQPQIESWQGNRLEARAAVAITDGQSSQSVYGVIWFTART